MAAPRDIFEQKKGAGVERHVFLLRGIGPATHRVMTMSALESACQAQGLPGTKNLLATGNLVVPSDLPEAEVEARFAAAMASGGLNVTWHRRAGRAFMATIAVAMKVSEVTDALRDRPSKVQVHFVSGPVPEAALDVLRAHAPDAVIARAGAEVIIDYGPTISASPLTVARIDKALGRDNTARNWNTLQKIAALL
jgi:uncharacterized protein (DUF1697 family)